MRPRWEVAPNDVSSYNSHVDDSQHVYNNTMTTDQSLPCKICLYIVVLFTVLIVVAWINTTAAFAVMFIVMVDFYMMPTNGASVPQHQLLHSNSRQSHTSSSSYQIAKADLHELNKEDGRDNDQTDMVTRSSISQVPLQMDKSSLIEESNIKHAASPITIKHTQTKCPLSIKHQQTKCCLAEQIILKSTLISHGPPNIFKITDVKRIQMQAKKISKCEIGTPSVSAPPPGRVLMLVGATGAGKTTLMNGICNYIYGVQWNDNFRFQMISNQDEGSQSQTQSQTKWITAYTFHRMEGSPLHYTLTVIDTPGFGDTNGLERDKEITAQIKDLFSIKGENGIDQIHVIGFVAQAPLARLTPPQRYVFDEILSIFGRDVGQNIFIMATFADNKPPPVLEAMKEAGIPYRKDVKFNNSALFGANTASTSDIFDKCFWDMGTAGFKVFFEEFEKVEARSLQLTKEVLKERERLEANIQGLQPQIRAVMLKMTSLEEEKDILKKYQSQINENKDFKYNVNETHQQKIDLHGQFVTNCLECNVTCHFPCQIPNDKEKYNCAAMTKQGDMNTTCTVCSRKCSWVKHVNNSYRFEIYEKIVEKTSDELKKRYENAVDGRSKADSIISSIEDELQQMHTGVIDMIYQVHRSLTRLDKIALKPNPLSEVEYIDLLIESEKSEAKPGYMQRIDCYQKVKEKAKILSLVTDDENFERIKQNDTWAHVFRTV